MFNNPPNTLKTAQLAERWKISSRTVRRWKQFGRGPKNVPMENNYGVFRISDVIEFEEQAIRAAN